MRAKELVVYRARARRRQTARKHLLTTVLAVVIATVVSIGAEALDQYSYYTADLPDPDLVIRTSGEHRISNFLLWELAYSELIFTEVLWPDFRREHLFDAVREFQQRERRFGSL